MKREGDVPSAAELVAHFGMSEHPEGGFFKETYRSSEQLARSALPSRFSGPRSFATSIVFLLPEGAVSKLHRLAADEVWHYHHGDPVEVVELFEDGRDRKTILGPDVGASQNFQHVVPAGVWFGSRPLCQAGGNGFALVGCTVAPGFDFADFELAKREELVQQFPAARSLIEAFT